MVHVIMSWKPAYCTRYHELETSILYTLSCAGTQHMVHFVMCWNPAYDTCCQVLEPIIWYTLSCAGNQHMTLCHVPETSIWYTLSCAGNQHMVHDVMRVQRRFKVVCASAQSKVFLPEEILDPWLPIERPSNTLIRQRRLSEDQLINRILYNPYQL